MTESPFVLSALDLLPDRPFTCPSYNQHDLAALEQMAELLRTTIEQEKPTQRDNRLDIFYLKESDGRPHRVVISNWNGLYATGTLVVVGFFGHRRIDADTTQTHIADAVLLQEFTHHPDLLSYSSLELPDGNWGNLVLFRSIDGPYGWGHSKYHAQIAQEISPNYYHSIRLHNGELADGLFSGAPIRLTRTKYFDFGEQLLWKAVRTL
jgi:hypothetical protein